MKLLEIPFTVLPSDAEEIIQDHLSFEEVVMDIARAKAKAVAKDHPEATVLGFDTLVILDDEALGKPTNRDEAFAMLRRLSGRTHRVLTGCALVCCDRIETLCDGADVTFYPMTDDEINDYLDTGEPFDKAGAYGIQGYGGRYIQKIDGDFYSVMGLPLAKLYRILRG
jgi:septum formation protein